MPVSLARAPHRDEYHYATPVVATKTRNPKRKSSRRKHTTYWPVLDLDLLSLFDLALMKREDDLRTYPPTRACWHIGAYLNKKLSRSIESILKERKFHRSGRSSVSDFLGTMQFCFLLLSTLLRIVAIGAFTASLLQPCKSSQYLTRLFNTDFLKQQAYESNGDYMKRLSKLAADPTAFELAAKESESKQAHDHNAPSHTSHWTPTTLRTPSHLVEGNVSHKKEQSVSNGDGTKKGYQRVEDWEHDQQELLKEMNWEQRVQYEGQKYGNQFNQNEILKNSLKRW
jgi:hypothetical protein